MNKYFSLKQFGAVQTEIKVPVFQSKEPVFVVMIIITDEGKNPRLNVGTYVPI